MRRILLAVAGVPAALAAPTAANATVPPGAEDGVAIVREQAETAAVEYFAGVEDAAVSNIVCETPSPDEAGVVFYCFGINDAGAPVVAQATINDHGTPELDAASSPTATTAAPTTTSPVLGSAQGTGSQVVQVAPINGPAIV